MKTNGTSRWQSWPMTNFKSPVPKHQRQIEKIKQHNFTEYLIVISFSLYAAVKHVDAGISQVTSTVLEIVAGTH